MAESRECELNTTSMSDTDVSASVASSSYFQNLTTRNESIEESKVHWSHLADVDSDLTDDEIVADNREVFKSLQLHPVWGKVFITFNEESGPSLVVGEKFAEGAQAEIFNASVDWHHPAEYIRRNKWELQRKYALKVFKKGTLLQHLQSHWPHGYLQWRVKDLENHLIRIRKSVVRVLSGTLLSTGEFAFLMTKEDEDLRSLIVGNNAKCDNGCGPFHKERSIFFMYRIARGVDWLHKRNIVHRDLKASNILVSKDRCYVGDYECSIGVIGTGFWRDPQILQACKERNASQRPELFTRAADVYSYAMTCYEILTGKLPFEGEAVTIDLVIEGQRPKVPDYVDKWIHELLCLCWHSNRDVRPTFEEIMNTIVANASSPRLKAEYDWNIKDSNEEINPLLGCVNLSHSLELLEYTPNDNGVYKCRLCLQEGSGPVYHCSPCGDFDLHLECATIPLNISSFMHPHDLFLVPRFVRGGTRVVCNACQLEVLEGTYYTYRCPTKECDFHLHIHCAKYARTMSHHFHEEHEFELITMSTLVGIEQSLPLCNDCNIQIDPLEIVYRCRECGFNIHPHCIIGKLECKSW